MTRRSGTTAYGLDSGPDETDWRRQGACNNYDPDLWGSTESFDRSQAVWVCQTECPVRSTCYRWANEHRELVDQMVYGGTYWSRGSNDVGASRSRLARPALQQPTPMPPTGHPAHRRPEIRSPQLFILEPTPDPRCGTRAGYSAHRRRGELACQPCKVGALAARREWEQSRAAS